MDSLVRSGFAPERAVHRRSVCPYGSNCGFAVTPWSLGSAPGVCRVFLNLPKTVTSLSFTVHAAPCDTHDTRVDTRNCEVRGFWFESSRSSP